MIDSSQFENNSLTEILTKEEFDFQYNTIQKIGEGAHGSVYQIIEQSSQKEFAMKVVRTNDVEKINQLKTEFKILSQLNHPNIIQVYSIKEITNMNSYLLIMEYLDPEIFLPLDQFIKILHKKQTNLQQLQEEIKFIFSQIIKAINYMHRKKIVHRDLTPDNILVGNSNEEVKIIDFGVAKQMKQKFAKKKIKTLHYIPDCLEMDNNIILTPTGKSAYFSPQKTGYNETVDVWSFGLLLLQAYANCEVTSDQIIQQGEEAIKKLLKNFNDLNLIDLVIKCLNVNQIDRITIFEALQHPYF